MSALAILKRRGKALAAQTLRITGAPRLHLRRQSLLVLCYHRVLPADQLARSPSSPHITISDATFARQMAHLAATCAVLPLENALEALARKSLPRNAVAITFDDGWKDTLTTALPILERHGLPALVYLTTGFMGSGRVFWQERLTQLVRRMKTADLAPPANLPPDLRPLWPSRPLDDARSLIDACKLAAPDAGERLTAALAQGLGPSEPDDVAMLPGDDVAMLPGDDVAMLSWDDVRAMQALGVAFGSHTVDHQILPRLSPEACAAQLTDSRQALRTALGQDIRALAYPNGDHTLAVRKAALEAGYTSAATLERGFNDESMDLMRLRRVNLYERKTAGPKGYEQALFQWVLMTGK